MSWLNADEMLKAHIIKKRREFSVDVSLELENGTSLGLFGASGAGKSTLLACIAGIEEPDGGYSETGARQCLCAALPRHTRSLRYLPHRPLLYTPLRASAHL